MKTRRQARDDVELQKKIRDIQLKKDALVEQVEQAQAQAADLLNKLNEAEQEEASLSAERGKLGQEPDGSEMDVDPAVPNFPQTRDENLPTNEGDPAVKTKHAEGTGEASQAGGSTIPQSTGTANRPIRSTKRQGQSDRAPAKQVDDDDDDDVLVDMQSLSISADGVVDTWFRARQGTKAIVRLGPKRYPKYEVRPGKGYSTAKLQQVSDTKSQIICIMARDKTGKKQRLYGIPNIAGYDGVAIVGNGVVTSSSRAPTTWDMIAVIGQDLADETIRQLWNVQEKRHAEWEGSQMGRRSVDRSPTPCPLDVYQEIRKGHTARKGIPLASGVQTSSHSPPPAAGSPTPEAAEAAEASGSAAHSDGQDSSGNPDADEQEPKIFSECQHLENMKQDLDLENLRNEDPGKYIEQMALVRAKFNAYRGEMETQDYVLVH
ncbi:hypothetical protein ASPFODRAFT_213026 [Aspergillus luchuensis CBS 106.47]|uniref:Uncharacterized protein n=1 Tax=Aspergillus luchuensis (strain CBS 106.47) TaxID=1137211 RepID=A0A1M3SZH5_ASPLC|nr:hypothetical protein ASPFODRAFT_213026 [Aspergillus luchuensis CBS 106.47]